MGIFKRIGGFFRRRVLNDAKRNIIPFIEINAKWKKFEPRKDVYEITVDLIYKDKIIYSKTIQLD